MKRAIVLFLLVFSVGYAEWKVEVLSETPKIVLLHDFLTHKECDHLIQLAAPSLKRSTVVDESGNSQGAVDSRRTSQGTFLTRCWNDKVVQSIENRLAKLGGYPKENGESIQVLFYEKGAEYRPHFDFFNPETPGGNTHLSRGGQRVVTILMYLNTPTRGGETIFPRANVSVTPVKGTAVLFYNCTPSGETDSLTLHGGAPVIEGEKWIATKWLREREFN